jgi:hypothetical protein
MTATAAALAPKFVPVTLIRVVAPASVDTKVAGDTAVTLGALYDQVAASVTLPFHETSRMGRLAPVPAGEVHETVAADALYTTLAQLNAPIETAVTAQSEAPAAEEENTICVPPAAGPEDAEMADAAGGTLQHELMQATQLEPTAAGL